MPVIRNQSRFEVVMNLLNNCIFVLVREVWLGEHGCELVKSTGNVFTLTFKMILSIIKTGIGV